MKYLIPLILLLLISCKQEKNLDVVKEKTFDYTSYLLSHMDSVATLEIEFDQPDSLFFEELNNKLLPGGCETFKDFNIKIDSLTIAARLAQPCETSIYCGIKLNVEVLINGDNLMLFEQELVSDTSNLRTRINRVLKDKNEYAYKNRTGIVIVRDKKANQEISKFALNVFVESYTKHMDSIALNHYNKNLEKLSLKELDELKKERILVLEYWNYPKPRIPEMEALEKLVSDLIKNN